MKFTRLLSLFALALFVMLMVSCHGSGWSLVDWKIKHDFPEVERITPTELAVWLQDPKRPAPVLLDVRTQAEYEVSHLKNAERVQPDSPASAIHLAKDQPIVTYCSVGYRSGAFAQTLEKAGYTNVHNMEGSIFKWANEGRPVYRDRKRVEKVHPYNKTWGRLLDRDRQADVPPDPK